MRNMKNTVSIITFLVLQVCIINPVMVASSASNQSTQATSSSLFTPSMSIHSINEKSIDAIYGKSGLNLPVDDVTHIKQTYGYIESIVRLNKIKKDPTMQASFSKYYAGNKTKTLIAFDITNSPEWNAIVVTNQDIVSSDFWQLYLKTMIVDYFDALHDFIESISLTQNQMFPYLANLELNFYNNDFIKLRLFAESLRAQKILQDLVLQRCITQCVDWKGLNSTTLVASIKAFKATDFYKYTHDKNMWTTPPPKISHPLQEYVMSYFMLTTIQSDVQKKMTNQNLFQFLTQASSPTISPNFFNYLPIDMVCFDDVLILQQLSNNTTAVTSVKGSQQKTFDLKDLVDLSKVTDSGNSQNVKIQKKGISVGSITHSISHAADDVVHLSSTIDNTIVTGVTNIASTTSDIVISTGEGIKQVEIAAGHAAVNIGVSTSGMVIHGSQGVALGSAGFGATMLGDIIYAQTGNASMKNWGAKESAQGMDDIQKCGNDINAVIANTALFIEDGIIAPIALLEGAELGILTQNKQLGQDLTLIINQVADSVVNLGATYLIAVNNIVNANQVGLFKMSESAAELVVDGIMVVYGAYTGQTNVENRSIAMTTDTAKQLVSNTIQAATSQATAIISGGMSLIAGMAAVMASVENSMTTVMFDIVDEVVFLGCDFGALMGVPVNPDQEREKINAKMEEHRGTINIIMGVILMVVLTVATCGVAAPEAGAMIGGDVALEGAGEGAVIAGSETAGAAGAGGYSAATQAVMDTTTAGGGYSDATLEVMNLTSVADSAVEGAEDGIVAGGAVTNMSAETGAAGAEGTGAAGAEGTGTAGAEGTGTAGAEGTGATETTTEVTAKQAAQDAKAFTAFAMDMGVQALNVGMSVFGVIGGINADDAAVSMLAQEKASIMNLWQFIENNKVVMTQEQDIYLDELTKKHQSVIENQTFGLNYYTNYLNGMVNNIQNQISHALSQQYIALLTPDATGSRIADIGSTWGLTTPFVYLYPSQGFLTTTMARQDFPYAQEIAQAPQVAQTTSSKKNSDSSSVDSSALWFNQRAVSTIDQAADAPLDVEIKFRVIYNLTTEFHIGLYVGGKYYDYNSPQYLADINNTGTIHLDDAHLAKMFVLKRDAGDTKPSIGIYENEGKGWIASKQVDPSLINRGSICHMSAHLNKDMLTVGLWPEDKPALKQTTTVKVTPSDQKTFGVIFSGAAIEWNVVTPLKPIQVNSKVRAVSTTPLEADRERAAKKAWTQLLAPAFGSMNLTILDKKYLLQGQYVYATKDTLLKDKQGNILNDIVTFAIFVSGNTTNIGSSPTPADVVNTPNAIISMISGNIYNAKGVLLGTKDNPWAIFTQNNGPFDQALTNIVTTTQQALPPKPVVVVPQTISLDNFVAPISPSTGGLQFGLTAPTNYVAAGSSFDDRQMGAADGSSFDFGDDSGTDF